MFSLSFWQLFADVAWQFRRVILGPFPKVLSTCAQGTGWQGETISNLERCLGDNGRPLRKLSGALWVVDVSFSQNSRSNKIDQKNNEVISQPSGPVAETVGYGCVSIRNSAHRWHFEAVPFPWGDRSWKLGWTRPDHRSRTFSDYVNMMLSPIENNFYFNELILRSVFLLW